MDLSKVFKFPCICMGALAYARANTDIVSSEDYRRLKTLVVNHKCTKSLTIQKCLPTKSERKIILEIAKPTASQKLKCLFHYSTRKIDPTLNISITECEQQFPRRIKKRNFTPDNTDVGSTSEGGSSGFNEFNSDADQE